MKEELLWCSGQLATNVTEFLLYQQKPPRQTPIDTVDRTTPKCHSVVTWFVDTTYIQYTCHSMLNYKVVVVGQRMCMHVVILLWHYYNIITTYVYVVQTVSGAQIHT